MTFKDFFLKTDNYSQLFPYTPVLLVLLKAYNLSFKYKHLHLHMSIIAQLNNKKFYTFLLLHLQY